MLQVANPIYDTVFKYLMEDEQIACIFLSALLQKKVTKVAMRRHEYTNGTRDKVSMFRIDFAATVTETDGSSDLVLVELQKTWVETETLRFRQYLGAHYANPENIIKEDNPMGYAMPMVTIYLLGHRVGDIEEPVLYVKRKTYDYYGKLVTKGIPDPFVDSLTHDSIIVQIPLLRWDSETGFERILGIFDQRRKRQGVRQLLDIEEQSYSDDSEMQLILRRLLSAAASAEVRQDMNVEDEYFMAIENRDTAIMQRDEKIKSLDAEIAAKNCALEEMGDALAEKVSALAEKESALAEKDSALAEKDLMLQSMVTALVHGGMSVEDIAKMVGRRATEIAAMLK